MDRPVAIEVSDVAKRFVIPVDRSHKPRSEPRELTVLEDISFEVGKGEFFGIVGRNGSGKSTLLKILASVYGADGGTVRVAGRLAPFLELGIGFNTQLSAYENVVLNAVMMGLTSKQARARYEEILSFAGLEEYESMQLKNYSSGMKVRLAFAVLTQVDADILLMDEVLAVGDSEFQEKCEEEFRRWQEEGRTVVLVTHSMLTINTYCDRAMLIDAGRIAALGDPIEVSNRYLEVNMLAASQRSGSSSYVTRFADVIADPPLRIVDAWLADSEGRRAVSVPEREPIEVHATVEVVRETPRLGFRFRIDGIQGQELFKGGPPALGLTPEQTRPGDRFTVRARVDNRLASGRYIFACAISQEMDDGAVEPATPITSVPFEVSGEDDGKEKGLLVLDTEVSVESASDQLPAEQLAR